MADHAPPADHAESLGHAPADQGGHATVGTYLKVAAVLAIITIIEVAIYYVEALAPVLPWVLIVLSALKFGLVAAFFMHLKFDSPLFTYFFVGGLLLAASVVLALMTLFGIWTIQPAHGVAH